MKYCPYCGTALADGAVSFCMECGKELPIKDAGRVISQSDDNEGVHQETAEFSMESEKEKADGKRSQKLLRKQNVTRKEQSVKKKRQTLNLSEEEKQTLEPDPEDDYDGYYDDILPADEGRFSEGLDKNLIKKVIGIIGAVLLIVALCVLMMYML